MNKTVGIIISMSIVATVFTGCGTKKDIKSSEILNGESKPVAADTEKKADETKKDTTNSDNKAVTDTSKEVANTNKPSNPTPTPAPKPTTTPTPTPTPTPAPKPTVQAGFDSALTSQLNDIYGLNDYSIETKATYFNSLARMVSEGSMSTSSATGQIKGLQPWDDKSTAPGTSGNATFQTNNPFVNVFKCSSGDAVKIVQTAAANRYTQSGNYICWGAYRNSDGTYTVSRLSTFLSYSVPVQ